MPSKPNKKPRPPERDYSHRSRLDKLGVKLGQRVFVLGVEDPDFLKELAGRAPEFSRDLSPSEADLIFFGAENVNELGRLKGLARAIQKNGAVWVITPKGRKDICDIEVIAAGKSAGLIDNKVVGFSATHTSLRFVIPVANR
jgi:glycine/D-amino acid oxidase-like deaminating enzyme